MREMVLVVDKPDGPTSFDVVRRIKRILPRGTKVGHGGSLDPFASGALIVLVGRATKLSGAMLNADKVYRATVRLGVSTDSMDRTGQVTATKEVPVLTEAAVEALFRSLEGEWEQMPPMYSAKKQNGVRLYTLARQNIEVKRDPIRVMLHRLTLLRFEGSTIEFEVHCSKGTYIRSLADEMGRLLGTVAHLEELRRSECGQFGLKDSCRLEDLESEPEPWFRKGFENYVKLLRTEGVQRRPLVMTAPTLPMTFNGGKSLQN